MKASWSSVRVGDNPPEGVQVVLLYWDTTWNGWRAELGCLKDIALDEWVNLWGAVVPEPEYWIGLPPIGGCDES